MAEPSLSSVLEGLEAYLGYQKLQGVTRVEVDQVVLDSLRKEVDMPVTAVPEVTTHEAQITPDSSKELFAVEGLAKEPSILFLCEEGTVESVYMDERGALLRRMIQAMEQTENEVGVVPMPSNLKQVEQEIYSLFENVMPRSCVVFGGAVLEQVLGKRVAFESMRGRWIELNGVRLMPTHALSHMLINPLMKKETWKDLQLVMKYLK
jgi:hypothetical protein